MISQENRRWGLRETLYFVGGKGKEKELSYDTYEFYIYEVP